MLRRKADRLFRLARNYVRENHPDELAWASSTATSRFVKLTSRQFLAEYFWVVYSSGFRVSVIEDRYPKLRRAYHGFDLERVARMKDLSAVHGIFANKRKARYFRDGAKLIAREGFPSFRSRVAQEGIPALARLPGIGSITKDQLARNIGLASVVKNDRHIRNIVIGLKAPSHIALGNYLATRFRTKPGIADLVLWRFCADKAWSKSGKPSLAAFMRGL